MAAPEPGGEHEGREYRLEAGSTFAFALTVTATQMYERVGGDQHVGPERVRLSIVNQELEGDGECAFLSPAEVDKLIRMLQVARGDMALG